MPLVTSTPLYLIRCSVLFGRPPIFKNVIEDKNQETSETGVLLKEPVDDNDANNDCFNESVVEIVPDNDDKNPMALPNFQPEHDDPCNDGSKKESRHESFNKSVDIIEKDKSSHQRKFDGQDLTVVKQLELRLFP